MKKLKVALAHDFLLYWGGAERVLECLTEIFPEAPIYTLLYDSAKMRDRFANKEIHFSFLQKFYNFSFKKHRWLLPLMPIAAETFDFRDFDLVISSSGAWSKGIVSKLSTIHIAYLHSPMRFLWDCNQQYWPQNFLFQNFLVKSYLSYLRIWDKLAASRPDYLIANSKYTQQRVQKYYRRDSTVIYPPLNLDLIENRNLKDEKLKQRNYFLLVSRLSAYKNVQLVVEAFNKLKLPLIIIGEGRQARYLKKIAQDNIQFLDFQEEQILLKYYFNARALIFPVEDDFGLAALEAVSLGTPVIALRKGGVSEIIEENLNGLFFNAPVMEVLADGVRRFMEKEKDFNSKKIIQSAQKFSKENFKKEIIDFIEKIIKK